MNTFARIACASLIFGLAGSASAGPMAMQPDGMDAASAPYLLNWNCRVTAAHASKDVRVKARTKREAEALAVKKAALPYGGKATCVRSY